MGGGIIGVTTAWYLTETGAEVTVLEREQNVGLETSFANCGQISPGYAAPWAAPGIPAKALKWLFQRHAPLVVRPDFSWQQIHWIIQMLSNCNAKSYNTNKSRMMRLAEYSRDKFKDLRTQIDISYEGRQSGTLQLFRTQQQLDSMEKDIKVLQECNVAFNVLNPQQCAIIEPALAKISGLLTGGLQLPGDETGDCHIFTRQMAKLCKARGVRFELGKSITHIEQSGNSIRAVCCGEERYFADHYVMALGSFSRQLIKTLKIDIPVYPVKGYSITIPILNSTAAPVSTIMDETYKVAITRFDNRVRAGGMAELSGYNTRLSNRRRETLEKSVSDLFPDAGDLKQASFWAGLRPMTPDGTPIIGASSIANLSINTGHGTLGWTMSLGSGKLLADQILGVKPEINIDGLSLARYLKQ